MLHGILAGTTGRLITRESYLTPELLHYAPAAILALISMVIFLVVLK
jgi:hypothetical protein